MEQMFGGIFEYENDEKLELFLNNATKEQALNIIEAAIDFCQNNGVYSLKEAHVLYKMLTELRK